MDRGRRPGRIRKRTQGASGASEADECSADAAHCERVHRYATRDVHAGRAKCGGRAGGKAPTDAAQPSVVGFAFELKRSLSTKRSDGWKLAMGTLFRSSSVSMIWLRIKVRNSSKETPNSAATSFSEYCVLAGLMASVP